MSAILKTLDIIIPVFNELGNIEALFAEINKEISGKFEKISLIVIDDGSSDNTSDEVLKYVSGFPEFNLVFVRFTRNYGKEIAVKCGIDHSLSDLCVIMDGDLQHPPKCILEANRAMLENNANLVYISPVKRDKRFYQKIGTSSYKRMINFLSKEKVYLTDFTILDRKAIEIVKQFNESDFYTRGILSIVGLKVFEIFYVPNPRFIGETKFSFFKLFNLAINGIISVSTRPLRLAIYLGIAVSLISMLFGIFLVIEKIRFGQEIAGFATLGFGLFFFAGLQLLFIGLIGEYVGKTFIQTKNRPLYTIDFKIEQVSEETNH
jgi:glycosyltransferase involved in cell wall biosynthesis